MAEKSVLQILIIGAADGQPECLALNLHPITPILGDGFGEHVEAVRGEGTRSELRESPSEYAGIDLLVSLRVGRKAVEVKLTCERRVDDCIVDPPPM